MVASEAQGTQARAVQTEDSELAARERPAAEAQHPALAARRPALESATRALTLASLALAPEQADLSDPTLARVLLREAFIRVGRAAAPEEPQLAFPFARELMNARQARAAIEARAGLPERLTRARLLDLSLELEGERELDWAQLRELEAWLADVLHVLAANPVRWFRSRWFVFVAAAVLGLLVVFLPRLILKPAWADYKWRASSTFGDYAISGTLGASEGAEGAFFHTETQRGPWLLIDMNQERSIHEIEIKNRTDCCFERALPLIAEVSSDGKSFSLVGWRDKVFAEWTVRFEPRTARYVRLRADAETMLHFAGVTIR